MSLNSISSHSSHVSSSQKIDFSGLNDDLVSHLAKDLNLDRFITKPKRLSNKFDQKVVQRILVCNMSPDEVRQLLTEFVESHPEAERQVARLILKYVGINKSVFETRRASSAGVATAPSIIDVVDDSESTLNNDHSRETLQTQDSSTELYSSFPLRRNEDILPNMSPVSWLSENSWRSMSYDEKVGFMEHILNGSFRSEHLVRSVHDQYYPMPHLFKSGAVSFGKGGVDRVVLGNGPRKVLVIGGM